MLGQSCVSLRKFTAKERLKGLEQSRGTGGWLHAAAGHGQELLVLPSGQL